MNESKASVSLDTYAQELCWFPQVLDVKSPPDILDHSVHPFFRHCRQQSVVDIPPSQLYVAVFVKLEEDGCVRFPCLET